MAIGDSVNLGQTKWKTIIGVDNYTEVVVVSSDQSKSDIEYLKGSIICIELFQSDRC